MTNYSKTINLPKTNLSMKANLSEKETKWLEFWYKNKIYDKLKQKNKKVFVRSNPNFMFAGKKLYLPSINEIKNLVYKNKKRAKEIIDESKKSEIYFFGN